MQLFLTHNKPWDTNYRLEGGDIIYKVSSPWKYVPRKTIIQRMRSPLPGAEKIPVDTSSEPESPLQPEASHDEFEDMAVIEYHLFRASKTRFQSFGTDAKNVWVDELFKTPGGRFKKGEDQVFFGPNGKEYTWRMREGDCELFYFKDRIWTQIATFQRGKLSLFGKSRPAVLNITEENETLRDLILLTFVYLERLRVESDRPSGGVFMGGAAGGGG
ncbi:hypothetical protein M413DRAFT_118164 [Hebeloma cylindrosporum]|uniref:DUF6593 domain-containing protein n=1 Tax=Hebeloma cylindrosporum TaxID=76867 RepID=A0A0C3D165_HEBCY|nr:hypothetical protein M413DRAFT_118164 [Hebeloma cylindrosporum h7]